MRVVAVSNSVPWSQDYSGIIFILDDLEIVRRPHFLEARCLNASLLKLVPTSDAGLDSVCQKAHLVANDLNAGRSAPTASLQVQTLRL